MIALALALLAVQGWSPDSARARAESLLAAGNIQAALKLAQHIVNQRPRDAAAHFLLGRVHYARPVIGRYPALAEFKQAARLDPTDPAPLYWQMKVGFYLRSDEGDYMAREALLKLFALTPDYLDAWVRFHDVYHSAKIWRRAERALAGHGEDPIALERRAELLIALRDGRAADSLLAIVVSSRGPGAPVYLLRAEAAFLKGERSAGLAWHDSALARADSDSTDALWREAWLIASPSEVARHATTVRGRGERRAFYERFWQERDPDLLTRENERVPEHYARRAEARRVYRLLHPQRSTYHSKWARALKTYELRQDIAQLAREDPQAIPGPSSEPGAVAHRAATLNLGELQEATLPLAFRAGVTSAGLVFVRHGRPDRQGGCVIDLLNGRVDSTCRSFLDNESWLYWTPQGPLSVRFSKGGEYFDPVSQLHRSSSLLLLETDRSTLPAPLAARAWSALFRSADLGLTDVYYRTTGDSAAAVLWDTAGQIQPIRASGPGLLQLSVPPGPYRVGVDVDSAGKRGRWRRDITVPYFSTADLGLSSLVLAPSSVLLDREAALHRMPVDFVYPAGTPLASYVEIYGLTTGQSGRSHYHLRYSFEPVRSLLSKLFSNARAVVFEFDREIESSTSFERLIIEPDRLPAGRYRVTLSVTDLTRNVKSESVALEIEIR